MNRTEMLERVRTRKEDWDFIIIGGGATGIGCAVDAASRGFSVLLVEQSDFGKGTSSRSTKLVHGGVRYLAQGNVSLVREALKERGILSKNAPHLVHKRAFVIPVYNYWDKFFYSAGLKTYNILSGKSGFGKSQTLSKEETIERLPNIKKENLQGGILYFDGQFDDSRLLINLAQTAAEQNAVLLNYARVFAFNYTDDGKIDGVAVSDEITGQIFLAKAKVVINAAGAFCDNVRQMSDRKAEKIISPSQGIHLVFDKKFLPSENALMIPKTSDERVLFGIPWHDHAVFGTTDTPIEKPQLEPKAQEKEIEFILETAKDYLENPPTREDILSVFVGIRPLVKAENTKNTASLSRDHTIETDKANLLTITGGKWTTYRAMAEDAVDQAIKLGNFPDKKCVTEKLKIHGFSEESSNFGELEIYGSDALEIQKLIKENPSLSEKIHPELPYTKAEIVWFCRNEMAQTIEDILARRTRTLFLNAKAAVESAPQIAEMLANELGLENKEIWIAEQLEIFNKTAQNYLV
ncbi:MAG TPA: glycerol-3-phosphate dehydrogenase/oxidase [Pyrinomonadaceae bacterium]|nr:glycerol-3-phosphate dehydrogenase/oxidase [Pyrinomonadaceae bacterium]